MQVKYCTPSSHEFELSSNFPTFNSCLSETWHQFYFYEKFCCQKKEGMGNDGELPTYDGKHYHLRSLMIDCILFSFWKQIVKVRNTQFFLEHFLRNLVLQSKLWKVSKLEPAAGRNICQACSFYIFEIPLTFEYISALSKADYPSLTRVLHEICLYAEEAATTLY